MTTTNTIIAKLNAKTGLEQATSQMDVYTDAEDVTYITIEDWGNDGLITRLNIDQIVAKLMFVIKSVGLMRSNYQLDESVTINLKGGLLG
jgi:hypothetical protein